MTELERRLEEAYAIAKKTTGLGEYLTDAVRAVARENPRLPACT